MKHLAEKFAGMRASDITTATIKEYLQHRQEQGAMDGTIKRGVSALRRMFNVGMENSTVKQLPGFPKLKGSPAREGFIEDSDFSVLYDALPDHIKPLVFCLYRTGMRFGEAINLTWEPSEGGSGIVDIENREIRLKASATKTGKGRTVPLDDWLYETFCAQKKERDSEKRIPRLNWVWHRKSKTTGRLIRFRDIRKRWSAARKKLGRNVLIHDLRRSGIRQMVREGIDEKIVMEISGHKTRAVFDRYNVTGGDDMKRAAEAMSRKTPPQFHRTKQLSS